MSITTAPTTALVHVARQGGDAVVSVLGGLTRRTASVLSCRLHEAIAAAERGSVITVDLGAGALGDVVLDRVVTCARESALASGIELRLR